MLVVGCCWPLAFVGFLVCVCTHYFIIHGVSRSACRAATPFELAAQLLALVLRPWSLCVA
jgi:hypothetical protein